MNQQNNQSLYTTSIKNIQYLIKKSRPQKSSIITSSIVALYISNQSKQQNPQYQQKYKYNIQKNHKNQKNTNNNIYYYWQYKKIGLLVIDIDRILKTSLIRFYDIEKLEILLQFQLYPEFLNNYVQINKNFYTFQWLSYFNVGFLFKNQFQAQKIYQKISEQIIQLKLRQQYANQQGKSKLSQKLQLGRLQLPSLLKPKQELSKYIQQIYYNKSRYEPKYTQMKYQERKQDLINFKNIKQEQEFRQQPLSTVEEGFVWLKNKFNQITDEISDMFGNQTIHKPQEPEKMKYTPRKISLRNISEEIPKNIQYQQNRPRSRNKIFPQKSIKQISSEKQTQQLQIQENLQIKIQEVPLQNSTKQIITSKISQKSTLYCSTLNSSKGISHENQNSQGNAMKSSLFSNFSQQSYEPSQFQQQENSNIQNSSIYFEKSFNNSQKLPQFLQLPPIPHLTLVPNELFKSVIVIPQTQKKKVQPIFKSDLSNLVKQIQEFKFKSKPANKQQQKPRKIEEKKVTIMDELAEKLRKRKKQMSEKKIKNSDSESDAGN